MIVLDAADLAVIAARTLGISTDAVLAVMDIPAAQAALDVAQPREGRPGAALSDRDAAAAAGVRMVHALLRYRPFPREGRQVAVCAGLQFLSLNGWQADLIPPRAARPASRTGHQGRGRCPGDSHGRRRRDACHGLLDCPGHVAGHATACRPDIPGGGAGPSWTGYRSAH